MREGAQTLRFAVQCQTVMEICPAQVFLTDLEWAGKSGEAKLPIFMNHSIEWPPGASDNQLITQEHDVHWMNELLSG